MWHFPSRMMGDLFYWIPVFYFHKLFILLIPPISVNKITNIPETHSLKTLEFSLTRLPHPLYPKNCQTQWIPHTQSARNLSLSFHFSCNAVRPFTLWATSECIPALPRQLQLLSVKPSSKLLLFKPWAIPLCLAKCVNTPGTGV